ncbi:MAG: cell filamentation protein Fic, partial [Deltaproteobacteria bacterium]|nr:cell filamentation protein Fic [Deltaproteobacteria bacterium]
MPNWHKSLVTTSGIHRIDSSGGIVEEVFPPKYWPGDTLGEHLEFALKYDGTNLAILSLLFQKIEKEDLLIHVRSQPTGKYARRLWFLYEFLTGKTLPLDDLKRGNYIDLLEPYEYYTISPPRQVRRQRVNDNLLGDNRFCPVVRRTDTLCDFEKADLPKRCRQVVAGYPASVLKRALGYLYTRETKSSFEIEHVKPTSTRTERFVALLQTAEQEDFCRKGR